MSNLSILETVLLIFIIVVSMYITEWFSGHVRRWYEDSMIYYIEKNPNVKERLKERFGW